MSKEPNKKRSGGVAKAGAAYARGYHAGQSDDPAESVAEASEAVSDAGRHASTDSDISESLLDAAKAVAQAEAALSDIEEELVAAARASERVIHEALIAQERLVREAAAKQDKAIAIAEAAMERAMAATYHLHDKPGSGGVQPLPPGRRRGY